MLLDKKQNNFPGRENNIKKNPNAERKTSLFLEPGGSPSPFTADESFLWNIEGLKLIGFP